MRRRHTPHLRSGRRGAINAAELLLILPIVLALLLGMIEYSIMLSVEQRLAVASREGARVAAQGGSASEVEVAARITLGSGQLNKAAVVTAILEDNSQPIASGQPVEVSVSIADATTVVPNLLRFVGFSIKDRPLVSRTILRKE